jgi:hypothetical protein
MNVCVHDMVVRVIESVVTKRTVQYNAPRVMMISLAWVEDKSAALVDMAFLCDAIRMLALFILSFTIPRSHTAYDIVVMMRIGFSPGLRVRSYCVL